MTKLNKRLKAAEVLLDSGKFYTPEEAVELAKKTATTKFLGSIEVHVNLGIDAKAGDQVVRGQVKFPHSTGKSVKIAAFVTPAKEKEAKVAGADVIGGEELIKSIQASEKTDFDIAVAEPALMPKLAAVAKILGPRGLMPNPRSGTVSPEVGKVVAEIKAGRVDFKNDDSGNVHALLGKADAPSANLVENLQVFVKAVRQAKPAVIKKEFISSIYINATMGPGIRV